jgi:hypothetical protein
MAQLRGVALYVAPFAFLTRDHEMAADYSSLPATVARPEFPSDIAD